MSAPEDNPADDIQPTGEEWDAAMSQTEKRAVYFCKSVEKVPNDYGGTVLVTLKPNHLYEQNLEIKMLRDALGEVFEVGQLYKITVERVREIGA